MDRQPQAFRLVRAPTGVLLGYGAYVALHEASESDLRADPGSRAMWEYAQRHGPPRTGEQVMAWRLFVDSESDRRPSRSDTLIRLWHGHEMVTRVDCSWDFVSIEADRAYYGPMFAHYDFHLAPEAGYQIGGRRYDVYAHDWRRLGVDDWLEMTAERELGAPFTAATGTTAEVVLSEPEFAEAVRAALRDLHHPERLAGNPLARSRLIRDRGGGRSAAETLRAVIGEAADALRDDPREEAMYRVIDRTFLRPAPTQERAAELLDLPFSTYRRYRNRGVDRIVGWLWQRELYGPDGRIGHQMDTRWPGG
jgi:hypothetical protein